MYFLSCEEIKTIIIIIIIIIMIIIIERIFHVAILILSKCKIIYLDKKFMLFIISFMYRF